MEKMEGGCHIMKENKNNKKVKEMPAYQVKLQEAATLPVLRPSSRGHGNAGVCFHIPSSP